MRELLYAGLVFFSVLVTLQSAHTLYLTLYTWDRPPAEARAPEHFLPPRLSFTVMLPARHEEAVIATTIERVVRARYPANLIQVLVVCSADDDGTIAKAQEKIELPPSAVAVAGDFGQDVLTQSRRQLVDCVPAVHDHLPCPRCCLLPWVAPRALPATGDRAAQGALAARVPRSRT